MYQYDGEYYSGPSSFPSYIDAVFTTLKANQYAQEIFDENKPEEPVKCIQIHLTNLRKRKESYSIKHIIQREGVS